MSACCKNNETNFRWKTVLFLINYTGHELVNVTKVEEKKQGLPLPKYEKLVETLHECVTDIARICPRILMIFDCCYAATVADLFRIRLDDDAHVEWHAQWCSSRQNQKSEYEYDHKPSIFTDLVVSALKGGNERQCSQPTLLEDGARRKTAKCEICMKFRKYCRDSSYVCLYDIAEFVSEHMHSLRQQEASASDMQEPVLKGTFVQKPVISYFNKEPTLYTFVFESGSHEFSHEFRTDNFAQSNILSMTANCHHKDACPLKVCHRYSMKELGRCYSDNSGIPHPILDAVSKDNKCLLVKIDDTGASMDGSGRLAESNLHKTEDDSIEFSQTV